MAITLRNTKGSALTYEELDGNFTDLNGRVLDSDGIRALVDSDYVAARMTAHYNGFDSDFGTKSTTNLSEGTNLYYTTSRHDSDFAVKLDSSTTDNLSEGTTNLYYTTTRADSDFGTKSTSDLTEGNNLYYTTARHDSDTQALVDSNYVQARQSTTTPSVTIQDEGVALTTAATTLNFVGAGVTASGTGVTKTITISGGSDSGLDSAAAIALIDSAYVQAREVASISSVLADTTPELGGNLDVNGNTIQYRFNLTASGTDHYVFNDSGNTWFDSTGENDPTLYLRRGETYVFNNTVSGAHPFRIQDSALGVQYDTGVTNNANSSGNLVTFTPRMTAPTTLYYRCTNHSSMAGTINIV